MRVFVTGGTGFVGPAVLRALLAAGHDVTALVRHSPPPVAHARLGTVRGDALRPGTFRDAVRGHDAVLHLVAIRRAFPRRGVTFERYHTEATRNVVDAARAADARRFVFMSASGVRADGTPYQRTKHASEGIVKASGIPWTVFRPTFITGRPEGAGALGFDGEFARIVRRSPVLPGFTGEFRLQPVARRDVAAAFVAALATDAAVGRTYALAGPDVLEWREYLEALARALGRRRLVAPVPRSAALLGARVLGRFEWFPASADELKMLFEGHVADPTPAVRDLGIRLTPFAEALAEAVSPASPRA